MKGDGGSVATLFFVLSKMPQRPVCVSKREHPRALAVSGSPLPNFRTRSKPQAPSRPDHAACPGGFFKTLGKTNLKPWNTQSIRWVASGTGGVLESFIRHYSQGGSRRFRTLTQPYHSRAPYSYTVSSSHCQRCVVHGHYFHTPAGATVSLAPNSSVRRPTDGIGLSI